MNGTIPRPRLSSIDWLRGLVMALMLIDHMREFLHAESVWHRLRDLSAISSAAYLTRLITHPCAPVFVLLAGVSVSLQIQAGKPVESVRRFLWTRGLWLIFCEFSLVTLGADFRWAPWSQPMVAQVIWVMGISMILMSVMIRLPRVWIFTIGMILVVGHNLLDPIVLDSWKGSGTPFPGILASVWCVLHQGGTIAPIGGQFPRIVIGYPLIPWPGVMALGYCLGEFFEKESEIRKRSFAWLGIGCLAAFVLLRAVDRYGEAVHWSHQATTFRTVLSFVNTTKYPPSLLFLLMTLGPGLLLLAWRDGAKDYPLDHALVTLGRVPMFFYLLQWPVAHGMGILFHFLAGKNWRFVVHLDGPVPSDYGFRLWAVYLGWALGLVLLYPLCRWFATVKRNRPDWRWLSYL